MEKNVKHLPLRKTDVLKILIFAFEEMHWLWRAKMYIKGISWGMFIVALSSSAVFLLQNRVSDFF